MNWVLAAPYISTLHNTVGGLWDIAENMGELSILPVAAQYEHDRSRKNTNISGWRDYWKHSSDTWTTARKNDAGIITAFPQLPTLLGLRKNIFRSDVPILAWTFNLGKLYPGKKQKLARYALKNINKFIVPSSYECHTYAKYLDLPLSRFEFVHLHKPVFPRVEEVDTQSPFLLAMGSANRDYEVLFEAVQKLKLPLVVVAGPHSVAGLDIPENVKLLSNLTLDECRIFAQRATINIVPIANENTASGQVTIIEAMMYGSAVIATDTIGSRDYMQDGVNGLLVKEKSVTQMCNAISRIWEDQALKRTLSKNARDYMINNLTIEKTAEKLTRILLELSK